MPFQPICFPLRAITRLYFTEGVFRCGHTRQTRSMTIVLIGIITQINTTSALQRKADVIYRSFRFGPACMCTRDLGVKGQVSFLKHSLPCTHYK